MRKNQLSDVAKNFTDQQIGFFATHKSCDDILNTFTNDQEKAVASMAQGMTWNTAMLYASSLLLEISKEYELVKKTK